MVNIVHSCWQLFYGTLLEYETHKVVQIHSKKVGASFRVIQLFFVLYVILWVMIKEKGYQKFDQAQSGVTAKLKGIAFANITNNQNIGASVWDAADYVVPPQQNSAFFVMTNLIVTPGQTLATCEESHDVHGNSCRRDKDCSPGTLVLTGGGVRTGRCVKSTRHESLFVCEIYGWCPTEHDIMPKENILSSAPNFTVILKNSIEFPLYRVKRRNILPWMDKTYLKMCRYNPLDSREKFCPIFRLDDIMRYTEADNRGIWKYGGMISIQIEWNCDLDYSEDECVPKYTFRRLDDFDSVVGQGWNFRFSQHYIENGVHKRNLIKAFGIQFFITVYGKGGKFHLLTFSMNLGSGLALLGIATVLCDMIILNVTRKRSIYRTAKVDLVVQQKREFKRVNVVRNAEKRQLQIPRKRDNTSETANVRSGSRGNDLGGNRSSEMGLQASRLRRRGKMPSRTRVKDVLPPVTTNANCLRLAKQDQPDRTDAPETQPLRIEAKRSAEADVKMSTMEQRLTETIAHYNVASHVKPPPPPSAPPPQLPPTTLAKVVAKPEDGTINRGVRCTPPLGRTGSSKRSIGHLTKVGGFMPPGASRQTEASYRHFVAPVEKKRRLWLFGVTSKSTELSDFRPVGPCGRTGQMEETGSSWSLGRSGPEGSHRQTKFICRTISQPIPTYQCMAGKSISPGGMQESPTYGVGYSCGEYAFRPDRGLFVGVPQIVVRALSPPTP